MRRDGLGKLGRYALTAGAAAVVDLGGFAALHALGLGVPTAATASYLAANVANYVLSARYAFGARASPARYPAFLAGSAAGLLVNVGVTALAAGPLGAPPSLAKLIGIGMAFGVNFAINWLVIFPARRAA